MAATTTTTGRKRGRFVVLEGGDCGGKTTQAARLHKALLNEGCPAMRIQFPYYEATPSGPLLLDEINKPYNQKSLLEKQRRHLLFVMNRMETIPLIEEWLRQGFTVICDRYYHSGIAYSMANGLSQEWCENIERDILPPDAVFYLRLSAEDACIRKGFGEGAHETLAFQQAVIKQYDKLLLPFAKVINASQSEADITAEILQTLYTK